MWYWISAIILFNLLVLAFTHGAGKANKIGDKIGAKRTLELNLKTKA